MTSKMPTHRHDFFYLPAPLPSLLSSKPARCDDRNCQVLFVILIVKTIVTKKQRKIKLLMMTRTIMIMTLKR